MASTAPPSLSSSYHEDYDKPLRISSVPSFSSLEALRSRRSGSSTPTCTQRYKRRSTSSSSRHSTPTAFLRSRHLSVSWSSTESLPWSCSSSRAGTPFSSSYDRSRSRSPRPPSESDPLEAPGVQQEALTRAFLYPSSLHRNLRLAAILFVTAHVSFKTLFPWLLEPFLNKVSLDWTPRSLFINFP